MSTIQKFEGKFKDLPYQRPDCEKLAAEMTEKVAVIRKAATYEEAKKAFMEFQDIDEWMFSWDTVTFVRHMIDTRDPFYDEEMHYYDVTRAKRTGVYSDYYDAMIKSPFRAQFEADFGPNLIHRMENLSKTHTMEIIPELTRKNELSSKYQKIIANCSTEFRGKQMNFYGLLAQMQEDDREVRKAAFEAFAALYEKASKDLDETYQELLQVITRMGRKLGYQNYIPVGYMVLGRDYTEDDLKSFRQQVYEHIVPLCVKLREQQAKKLGLDKIKYYDEQYYFTDGAPRPEGTVPEMIEKARKMYHLVHEEAGEFFDYIADHELYDLETKPGKTTGGYCRWLPSYCTPFIFSNFNGTDADIQVLTHEAGHGFAAYTYTKYGENPIDFLRFAPAATHEIQSQTMEFFCNRHIEYLVNEKDVEKYKYQHIVSALMQICYECVVDEFQHNVIGNPDGMTPAKMRQVWHEAEKKYMPWRDWDGNPFMEEGGFWMTKMHIFMGPLLYIEYGLAMICAMQYYGRSKEDYEGTWKDYYRFCHVGCRMNYNDILKVGNLRSPFEEGTVKYVVDMIRADLKIDD